MIDRSTDIRISFAFHAKILKYYVFSLLLFSNVGLLDQPFEGYVEVKLPPSIQRE